MSACAADVARLAVACLSRDAGTGVAVVAAAPGSGIAGRIAAGCAGTPVHSHPDLPGTGPVVQLSGADHDVLHQPEAVWPGCGGGVLQRQRRIDTLYAGHPMRLIVLAEPARSADILAGAAAVLAARQPELIVLPPAHAALAPAVQAVLASYPYQQRYGGLFWAGRSPAPMMDPALSAESIVVAFDVGLVCGGLHPPEWDAPTGGRWTGAAAQTWFALPRPSPGRWRLQLAVADWGNAAGRLAASLDGTQLRPDRAAAAAGAATIGFAPVMIGPGDTTMALRLFAPRPVRDLQRGPRMIGLRILAARLSPMAPPGTP